MTKTILALVFSLSIISAAHAAQSSYDCTDSKGETAVLTVKTGNEIVFGIDSESAYSKGVLAGVEQAPYSPRNGELQYKLVDFYQSEDSAYYISAPSALSNLT